MTILQLLTIHKMGLGNNHGCKLHKKSHWPDVTNLLMEVTTSFEAVLTK